jgi:hypothetical protein
MVKKMNLEPKALGTVDLEALNSNARKMIFPKEGKWEKGEKILDEEDDIEYYKEIVSDTDDLTDEQMDKIKSDCLESKKRK